jgi:cysteine-S-conjugate beta-lyase
VTGPFDLSLDELRQRQSAKWRLHDPDVLPLWVAEMDVRLAPCVAEALRTAVDRGDTGYAAGVAPDLSPGPLARAFAGFAERQWGWRPDLSASRLVADVMTGVAEVLQVVTAPGDGVVICPPVYPPFFAVPPLAGRTVVEVPLVDGGLDLDGIDRALAAGARAVLLSSPHNPTGRVWTAAELEDLDVVVRRHDAWVLADEIHAPLTLPGTTFSPYLTTERQAVVLTSASKAFNLPGLKAALLLAGSPVAQQRLWQVPMEVSFHAGHLGVLAGVAAFEGGDAWLAEVRAGIAERHALLADLLPPSVGFQPPPASYLAWLSFGTPRPAERLLREARVALVEGTDFGTGGEGFARLNVATSTEVLALAAERVASAL